MDGTYNNPFEIDDGAVNMVRVLVVVENGLCQLWYVMATITLSSNVEIPIFVFRKSLQPIHQEIVVVDGASSVSVALQIR